MHKVRDIDAMVAKMRRGLSVIKCCSAILTSQSTEQALQALALSHMDYCPVIWPSATKKDVGLEQSSKTWPLNVHGGLNINNMPVNLSWLKVEERLTSSLLVFVRGIDVLKEPNCLFKQLTHSSDTHTYPTRHTTRRLFTVPKFRTDYGKCTVLHRTMSTWNSSSKI